MKKKKLILGVLAVIVGVVVIVLLIVAAKLDGIVKAGIETVGPSLTKTTVSLGGVSIRPLRGSGAIKGLVVGNPAGYKGDYSIKMDLAQLAIKPGSLLADKIVIDDVTVAGPEIILEGGLKDNNLTAIQKNVNDAVGLQSGGTAPATPAAGGSGAQKKLQINHFKLTGAKVHLRLAMLAGKDVTIAAPDVEFHDLGTGPEGITVPELVKRVLNELTAGTLTAAAKSVGELGTQAADAAGKAATEAVSGGSKEAASKVTEGVKSLFKKKE